MKYITIFLTIIIISCSSSNENETNSNNTNSIAPSTTTDRYKISFQAEGIAGEKHFKATYIFNNGTPIVVNYDGNVAASGFATTNNIENIDFNLEMTRGSCYLKNTNVKIEDLQTGQTVINMPHSVNGGVGYIISPDMLTEKAFINNLYGYPPQNFDAKNNHKYYFYKHGNSHGYNYPQYSYRPEILVNKPTRGSLRIVVTPFNMNHFDLSIPSALAIRDYVPSSGMNEILSGTNVFSNNTNKTYELILAGHLSNINVNLKGMNVSAIIYLMRKNGTTQTVNVTSLNNQNIVTNLTL